MALLSVLFGKNKKVKINVADAAGEESELLLLDMARNISHVNTATPTEHAVEDGTKIADHVDVDSKTLSFEGIVSEAPLSIAQAAIGNVAGAIPAVGGFGGTAVGTLFTGAVASLGGLLLNGGNNRAKDGFNTLLEIHEKAIPVTLITDLRAYNNMILVNFNPVQSVEVGGSLRFTATFREIRIVQSELVVLPQRVLDGDVKNSATSKQNQGKKVAADAEGKGSSVLARLTGIGA